MEKGKARTRDRSYPRQSVHVRKAPRKAYHIAREIAWAAVALALTLSLMACAKGVYDVGYGNGLRAQEVSHAQR